MAFYELRVIYLKNENGIWKEFGPRSFGVYSDPKDAEAIMDAIEEAFHERSYDTKTHQLRMDILAQPEMSKELAKQIARSDFDLYF